MGTSINSAREALQDALANPDLKVIALTGKWGTGKTFLWKNLRFDNKKTLDISVFGTKTIDDMKRKLLQDGVKIGSTNMKERFATLLSTVESIPKKFFGFNMSDAALIILPMLLKGKIIIIDDVERKNRSFEISEILGFINEYTEKNDSRFLLILNTDNMEDNSLWRSLHEKVIDKEIVLSPSPEDSFSIAAENIDTPFINIAKEVFINHNIQNIRIIRKTLNAIREILSKQDLLPDILYKQYIPTMVFLSICHFRGFRDELTLDYAANYIFRQHKDAKHEECNLIINKAALRTDNIIELVIDYLRFGIVPHEDLASLLKPLRINLELSEFLNRIDLFLLDLQWNTNQTKKEVQDFIDFLNPKIYQIDVSQLSTLYNELINNNYNEDAEKLLSKWLEHASTDNYAYKKFEYLHSERAPKKLLEFKNSLTPPVESTTTLKETILTFRSKNQLTQKAINSLSSATQKEYEELLSCLSRDELKNVVELHFRLGEQRNEQHWESAQENFIAACKHISKEAPETRLGRILGRELMQRNMEV